MYIVLGVGLLYLCSRLLGNGLDFLNPRGLMSFEIYPDLG